MAALNIIFLSMATAILYGVVHDLVTAHVCVEYFTVGHPMIIPTRSPIVLALFWGIWATWWVGLMLGIPLAAVSRLGGRPVVRVSFLLRPIMTLMIVAGSVALVAGIVGWLLAENDVIQLTKSLADRIPLHRHTRFLADGFAHTASYGVGFFGGLILMAWVWYKRGAIPEQ